MKRFAVFVFAVAITTPAHAFLGFADTAIVYDPQNYAGMVKAYEQTKELYNNAKKQLDGLVSIEKVIKEGQAAAETLGGMNLKSVSAGLKQNTNDINSAAALRAALANQENGVNGVGQNASYMKYQLNQLDVLENLALLRKAQADNADQATGKTNTATDGKITAQAAAATAALAAAAEQRRVKEEMDSASANKAAADNMDNSHKVYEAMGK